MGLQRLVLTVLVGLVAGTVQAQVPIRRSATAVTNNTPQMLVANPITFTPQDSTASIQIGEGLRQGMEKLVKSDLLVVTRARMNEALIQFGYPPDAILGQPVQRTFANTLQAKYLLSSFLSKSETGQFSITARLAGVNDEAGNVVTVAQNKGQSQEALGGATAAGFEGAVKSADEAKACVDQALTAPDKAIVAANKAISIWPKNGLAHYCLGTIALGKRTKADSAGALKQFQLAAEGDPYSLPTWKHLAEFYEAANDTSKTVAALQQMLLVAPTDQLLRELAFKLFLRYQRPEAAEQAAEEGLKLEPTNADLWDLLSNARVYRGNYSGAVQALEQVVVNDSTKADSTFFLKITVMASQKPDTADLLKWAYRGTRKYPDNLDLNRQLLTAYTLTGQVDSSVVVLKHLIQLGDTTAVIPALAVAQALAAAKRYPEAQPFLDYALKYGDNQAKQNVAAIMLNGALPYFSDPQDLPAAAALLQKVVALAEPAGKLAPIANYYLGLATLLQVPKIDPEAEKQKSCALATQEQKLLQEAEVAFKLGTSYKPDDVANRLKFVDAYKPRVASMIKVYCK